MVNMYTQNSNRDLFLSQQWSQIDSQDWNTQISSQENLHRVPSTPGRVVLPPTPSTSGNQNASLSNSWSGRGLSQVVPQSTSHPSTPRGVNRENNFLRDIRYALHAVLSVMKDLPSKLQEVVLNSSGSRNNADALLCENLKKIVDEKMATLERVIPFLEKTDTIFPDNKQLHTMFNSGMEEFQKSLSSHGLELTNLNEEIKSRTEALKKQFNILRKLCLTESRKTHNILLDLKSSNMEKTIEELSKKLSTDIENLATISNNILEHLKEKEEEETSTLNQTLKEITLLKSYMRDLPSLIDVSVQKALNQRGGLLPSPSGGRNVRVANDGTRISLLDTKRQMYKFSNSPVARVVPRVKQIQCFSPPKKVLCGEPTNKNAEEKSNYVLDVLEYSRSSKEKSPFPFALQNNKSRQTSDTDTIFAPSLANQKATNQIASPLVSGSKRLEKMDAFVPFLLSDLRKERIKKLQSNHVYP